MRKFIAVLLVLIIVVAALLGWALYNIDSLLASYREQIIAAAERHTGRKVAFDGINVGFRGGIGIRVRGFSLAEAPAFGTGHFIRAADIHVNLRIRPLERRISLTRVVFKRPVIQVIRDARGTYNFSDLASRLVAVRRSPRSKGFHRVADAFAAPGKQESGPARGLPVFAGMVVDPAVARVEVSKGTLHYRDHRRRHQASLRKWDLTVDDLSLDRPFRAELAAAFLSDRQNLHFKGAVGPVGTAPRADAIGVDGTAEVAPLSWEALRRAFPGMSEAWPKALEVTGSLKGDGLAVKGTLKSLHVTGALDLTDSGLKYAGVLDKPRSTTLRIESDVRVTPGGITARQLDATLDDFTANGRAELDFGSPATLDLSLNLPRTDLGGLERRIPLLADYRLSGHASGTVQVTMEPGGKSLPRIQGTAAIRKANARVPAWNRTLEGLSATVEFSGHGATFRQVSARIGQTRLAGRVTLESFAPLAITYRLTSPSLRLADLGFPPDGTVLEDARGSGRLTRRDRTASLSWEGDVTAARGKLLGLDIIDSTARIAVRQPWLTLAPLRLKTLGGSLEADGRMQIGVDAPRFKVTGRLRGIDIRQYLAGTALSPEVEGSLDADFDVTGQGRTWAAVKPTLEGTAKATVRKGRILDFNLGERALRGVAGIKRLTSLLNRNISEKYPHIFKNETTVFDQIHTEVRAVGSRIVVNRIALTAKDYEIGGKGWVDLDGNTDLDGVLTVSENLAADLFPGLRLTPLINDKGQIEVPFTLRGPMASLKLQPRLKLIRTFLEKSVGRGVQGLLDLIPELAPRGSKKGNGEKAEEAPVDPIRGLIKRTLKLFGGER